MTAAARAQGTEQTSERTPEQEAAARAVGVWIHQFARTLKTCRLYDANNPTVIRFRAELAQSLGRLLGELGPIRLRFTSDDVLYEDVSLYPAKSRDDNLALAFYRDGLRTLVLRSGAERREVEVLVDSVLEVTAQTEGENDLVTTLWEAHLQHIDVDYVPADGEVGGDAGSDANAQLVPWPTPSAEENPGVTNEGTAEVETVDSSPREDRSDDWTAGDLTVEIEAGFEELEVLAPTELTRFQGEFRAEHEVPVLTSSIAIGQAYLAAGATAQDRVELARFLPRLLRQAVTHGSWLEARATLGMLAACKSPEWAADKFVQELLQPISVANIVEKLDAREDDAPELIALLGGLGDPAVDLLNLVLAESQSRKCRRLLAEAIAERCRENPERLAPWLADPRWFVVRNVVHILGWIGGPPIVGLLQTAARHADPRVRQEVVAALGQVDARLARPLLIRMLDGADTRLT
ncbi:MAG: HEAT repeat domain-containing protein, partial [Candidatus Eisenbacteria bacterium]